MTIVYIFIYDLYRDVAFEVPPLPQQYIYREIVACKVEI